MQSGLHQSVIWQKLAAPGGKVGLGHRPFEHWDLRFPPLQDGRVGPVGQPDLEQHSVTAWGQREGRQRTIILHSLGRAPAGSKQYYYPGDYNLRLDTTHASED
jgi:hypothetical protein